ncbi:MAG: ATP-binding protein [Endomicrobium sp.]|jgi:predicted AAA+ superfamily ATPase|nr:ATP-binding protein [Endomicrobium sp.]
MIKRELYLSKIRKFYDSDLVKIITGVRRSGKSVLLNQIIEELREKKVSKGNIIYINFENLEYAGLTDVKKLDKYVKNKITNKKKYYIFFDEIQNVKKFELAVNSLRATQNASIFITGSNSKLLSGELATHLTGRYIGFFMMPFTFKEVYEYSKCKYENREDCFQKYIEWGGMPQIYNLNDVSEYKPYLEDLYNSIVFKDIVERAGVKDINLLNRIMQFVIENIGGIFSVNSIRKFLKSEDLTVRSEKIYNYIDVITASLIINRANRYNIRGKKVIQFYEKYYLADLGLAQLKRSSFEKSSGSRLENIVYNELLARGYKVYVGDIANGEIDFIAQNFDDKIYIQVSQFLSDKKIIKREFGAFGAVKDNYPKYILSLDKINFSQDGIKHFNLVDWLLGKVNFLSA